MALAQARAPGPDLSADRAPDAGPVPTQNGPANSDVLAMVADARVDEEPASVLLASSGLEPTGDDWSAPLPEERAGDPLAATPAAGKRPDGRLGAVWDSNARDVAAMDLTLSRTQRVELEVFRKKYEADQARYEEVSRRTGVPPMLIAALHYRESSMNFGTYLHQGDPLGKPAVHVPSNIPVFSDWTEAAVHALNLKSSIREDVGLTSDSRDGAAMATYAEAYNGLGYHDRGLASPYLYAGSDVYTGGMYVADGKFSRNAFDGRLGVMTILQGMGQLDPSKAVAPGTLSGEGSGWQDVLAGDRPLRQSARGDAVVAMQERLASAGYAVEADGAFGPKTAEAIRRFQAENGLKVDGVVGVATASALQRRSDAARKPAPDPAPAAAAPDAPTPAPAPAAPAAAPAPTGGAKTTAPTARDQAWSQVSGGRVIQRGASGDAVRALQERLRARGYAVAIDGDFGPITQAAVRNLQAALGVAVDGDVGPQTAAALDGALGR